MFWAWWCVHTYQARRQRRARHRVLRGEPLRTKDQCPSDWKEQLLGIEAQLKKHNIFHNDVHVDNLVVNKDDVCVQGSGMHVPRARTNQPRDRSMLLFLPACE